MRRANEIMRTTLTTIASQTGGFIVSGSNDFVSGLRRMLEDNDAYYLLAYQSTNPRRDGKFRKIDVKVMGHPDYAVRTRKGYLAPHDKRPAPPSTEGGRGPAPLVADGARA